MFSPHVPASLSYVFPRQASHWLPVDRNHYFAARWHILDGPYAPLLCPVRLSLRAPSQVSRAAGRHLRSAVGGLLACVRHPAVSSFLVMLPRWAVAPWRHQRAPSNSLSVNWYTFSYVYLVVVPPRFIQAFSVISPSHVRQTPSTRHDRLRRIRAIAHIRTAPSFTSSFLLS